MRQVIRCASIALFVSVTAFASRTGAAPSYSRGTVFYQHIPAVAGSGASGTARRMVDSSVLNMPSQAGLSSVSVQSFTRYTQGTFTSDASSRAGHYASSTDLGIVLKSGTGVAQTDTGNAFPESRIAIQLEDDPSVGTGGAMGAGTHGLEWNIGSTTYSFNPYATFTFIGTKTARCKIDFAFYKSSSASTLGSSQTTYNVSQTWTFPSSGRYTTSFGLGSPGTFDRTYIHAIGTLNIESNNGSIGGFAPDGVDDSGITVIDGSIGVTEASALATFVGGGSDWFDSANWAADLAPSGANPPNSDATLAYFPNDQGAPRNITLSSPVRLGQLQVNGTGVNTFSGSTLTLNRGSIASVAQIWQSAAYGNPTTDLNMRVITQSTLAIQNDSAAPLNFNGGFGSTAGTVVSVTKTGTGPMIISGPITNPTGITFRLEEGASTFNSNAGSNLTSFIVGTTGTAASLHCGASQAINGFTIGTLGTLTSSAGTTLSAIDGGSSSGALTLFGNLNINLGSFGLTNSGQYTQNNGVATLGFLDGGGTTAISGGSATLNTGRIRQSSLSVSGTAVVRQQIGNNTPANVSRLSTLSVIAGGQLDLNNNSLIINYAGSTPLATIEALVASGRAGGTWAGLGVASVTAGAGTVGKFAIGIGEATDTSFGGAYLGFPIDDTTLILRYTLSGDCNLDGIVDLSDFSWLASSFNQTGRWATGDADYSGTVDIGDFSLFAANFNQSASDPPRTAIPEPGAVALVALLVLAGARFRQRLFVQ